VDSLLANTGAHDWTVPPVPTADARVRVTAEDGDGGTASDVNDLSFAVLPAVVPDLALRLPSGLAAADSDGTPLAVNAPGGQVVPVRAVTLAASADDDGVRLVWSAAVDGGVAGFRVLRAEAGDPAPVHPGLLPASARDYLDRSAAPGRGYRYWLEAVERDGARERFGPATVQVPVVALRAGLPYPNPTRNGAALDLIAPPGSPVRARVVDMRGRVVARLAVSEGTGPVIWDGRLDTGPEAPAGVYFIRVESHRASTTRRLVKVGP
jgi:hypothetical protein